MFMMIMTIFGGEALPSHICLENLGFEHEEGVQIVEKIMDSETAALIKLVLAFNPEWWAQDNSSVEMLKIVLERQEHMQTLNLVSSNFPYEKLRQCDSLPQTIKD